MLQHTYDAVMIAKATGFDLAFIGSVAIAVLGLCLVMRKWIRDADTTKAQRGFEVKQPTGETPVIRERDNDHG